jgi:hypothetical protein
MYSEGPAISVATSFQMPPLLAAAEREEPPATDAVARHGDAPDEIEHVGRHGHATA